MAIRFIQIAVIYFVIGVGIGLYMSIAHSYELTPVHVHINLLGWVSLGLAGLIYNHFPNLASTKLAKTHFWLHNIMLPIMMIGLGLVVYGQSAWVPVIAVAGTILVLAIIIFALNVLLNIKSKA